MKIVTSNQEYGYFADGEPTDAQIQLQDEIDGLITDFFTDMIEAYRMFSGKDIPDFEHDIGKISEIRESTEEQLKLPDIY